MGKPKIVVLSRGSTQPVIDYPNPERLLKGNPQRITHECFINKTGEISCGIWTCEVGAWRIRFADNKDEFFCVIEGAVRLQDESGVAIEVGQGEAAVIPAGFCGVFEVLEPVRKYYVLVERRSLS